MKKLLLLIPFCCLSFFLFATHNVGGEITYKQAGALTYEVTITTYTKTSSIPADRDSLEICWGDGTCEFIGRSNGSGTLLPNDRKKSLYTKIHTYPNRGVFHVSMTDPNRNGGIVNTNPPQSDQVPFYLEAMIYIRPSASGTNDSPELLNSHLDIGYVDQVYMHVPSHCDKEGDYITYELMRPLMAHKTPVTNYFFPHTIGSQPQSLSLNPHKGILLWNAPKVAGEYTIAIKIKEYRNGILLGWIMRDMQITIKPTVNRPPTIVDTVYSNYEIAFGQNIQFDIKGADADGDNLIIEATGCPLDLGATFTSSANISQDSIQGTFSWTPTQSMIHSDWYQMVFRVQDDAETLTGGVVYKVVRIKVSASVATKKAIKESLFTLYPNPATERIMLDLNVPLAKNAKIIVFDKLGRIVKQETNFKQTELLEITVNDLVDGTYFLFLRNGEKVYTQFFSVVQ